MRPADSTAHQLISGRLPELDGVRGVAILLVLVFHCRTVATPTTAAQTGYVRLAESGWAGVDLFFALSGFLITGILLRTAGSRDYFKSFYVRRVLRIFPLYYATLLVSGVLTRTVAPFLLAHYTPAAEISHWLYLQNWLPLFDVPWTRALAHLWSLAVEEQFYLFWPVVILLALRHGQVGRLCALTMLVAVVTRVIFSAVGQAEAAEFTTITRLDALAAGAYLAYLHQTTGINRGMFGAMAAVTAICLLIVSVSGGSFYRRTNPMILLLGFLPLALLWVSALALVLSGRPESALRRLLNTPILGFIGKVSYGVYVIHWPVVLVLERYWLRQSPGFWVAQFTFLLVVGIVSVALAALSFTFFEQPFLRLKERIARRPVTIAGASSTTSAHP